MPIVVVSAMQERSEQRVDLSILVLFAVTIFLTLSDFQLRALLMRRTTMETKQWCCCIKVRVETVLSKSDFIRNREKCGRNMTPGGNRERAMKSGVSRENREGWQVCPQETASMFLGAESASSTILR